MPHIANPSSAHPRVCGKLGLQFHTLPSQNKNQSAGEAAFSEEVMLSTKNISFGERTDFFTSNPPLASLLASRQMTP